MKKGRVAIVGFSTPVAAMAKTKNKALQFMITTPLIQSNSTVTGNPSTCRLGGNFSSSESATLRVAF